MTSDVFGVTTNFLSTLPGRGAAAEVESVQLGVGFSIHAPREGSGGPVEDDGPQTLEFSIHAPREGSGSVT